MNTTTQTAQPSDAQALADLRLIAMKPSLQAIGRFDPQRARQRFLKTFVATDTTVVYLDGLLAGFYVLRDEGDHLKLDHFYVHPEQQGAGLGSRLLQSIQHGAEKRALPIRLCALRGSRSNDFYQRHGFKHQYEETWDIYYQWPEAT